MTTFIAFLRGINLGKRQIKSADLKDAFEQLGFEQVRTLLASGNVIFEGRPDKTLQARIEQGLRQRFSFEVGTVLRTQDELKAMLNSKPFAGIEPEADVMRYVLLLGAPLEPLPKFSDVPDNLDIVRVDAQEIYVVGHKLPNGRYSEGMERLDRQLPQGILVTTRNWNTIEKAAQK